MYPKQTLAWSYSFVNLVLESLRQEDSVPNALHFIPTNFLKRKGGRKGGKPKKCVGEGKPAGCYGCEQASKVFRGQQTACLATSESSSRGDI